MKTKTAPWDYDRRVEIIPQKIKLCDKDACLGNMFWRDGVGYRCSSCLNTTYVIVKENEAADFRREVETAHEWKEMLEWELAAAIYKIDATEEQVDAFLALTERGEWDPFYLDEPTDTQLRETEDWLTSGEQADAKPRKYESNDDKKLGTWQDARNSRPFPY